MVQVINFLLENVKESKLRFGQNVFQVPSSPEKNRKKKKEDRIKEQNNMKQDFKNS